MPLTTEQLEYCREVLFEDDAVLFDRRDSTDVPLLGDSEIQRGWDELSPEDVPALIEYLAEYTSEKNTVPSKTVLDPRANNETFSGTYRQAYTRRITTGGQVSGIVQILRKGYITNLVTAGVIDWSEARLETGRFTTAGSLAETRLNTPETGGNTTEEYVTVKWNNVSPDNVQAIVDSLRSLDSDAFAPAIRGEAVGTEFHRLYVESKIEDDGSASINVLLAKPEFSLITYEEHLTADQSDIKYLWGVPKPLAQVIIDNAKAKGKTTTASYQKQTGLVDIIIRERDFDLVEDYGGTTGQNCDAVTTTQFYWGVEDPDIITIPASPTNGVTYRKQVSYNRDGTFNVSISITTRRYRDYDWRQTADSIMSKGYTKWQFGITDDDDIYVMPTDEQGTVYRQDIRIREDCSKDVTTTRDESVEKTVSYRSLMSRWRKGDTILHFNIAAPIEAPTEVTGTGIYRVRNSQNEDGTYNAEEVFEESTGSDEVEFDSLNAYTTERVTTLARNAETPAEALDDTQGVVYSANNSINEDGTYDTRQEKTSSVAQNATNHSTESALSESDVTQFRNQTVPIESPDSTSQGVIVSARSSINDDGTYDGTKETRTSKPAEVIRATVDSALATADTEVKRNQTVAAVASGAVEGKTVSASNRINEDGTYDSEKREVTSVASEKNYTSETTKFRKLETTTFRNVRDADLDIPEVSDSDDFTRVAASIRQNDDGTFDGSVTTETPRADYDNIEHFSASSFLEDEARTLYKNLKDPIDSFDNDAGDPPVGQVVTATNRINEDGSVDATRSVRTSAPDDFEYDSLKTIYKSATTTEYRNQPVKPPSASLPTDGEGNEYGRVTERWRRNADGTFDGSVTVEGTSAGGDASYESLYSDRATATTVKRLNADAVVEAEEQAIGKVQRVNNTINDDGTYNTQSEVVTSKDREYDYGTAFSNFSKASVDVFENQTVEPTPAEPTSSEVGKQIRIQKRLNEDGTYDTTVEEVEGVADDWEFTSSNNKAKKINTRVYRNAAAKMDATSPVSGGTQTTENTKNEFGLYDVVVRTTEPTETDPTIYLSDRSKLNSSERTIALNREDKVEVDDVHGNPQKGRVYSARNSINADGLFDTEEVVVRSFEDEEEIEYTNNGVSVGGNPPEKNAAVGVYLNQQDEKTDFRILNKLEPEDVGVSRNVSVTLNPDGTKSYVVKENRQDSASSWFGRFPSLIRWTTTDPSRVYNIAPIGSKAEKAKAKPIHVAIHHVDGWTTSDVEATNGVEVLTDVDVLQNPPKGEGPQAAISVDGYWTPTGQGTISKSGPGWHYHGVFIYLPNEKSAISIDSWKDEYQSTTSSSESESEGG